MVGWRFTKAKIEHTAYACINWTLAHPDIAAGALFLSDFCRSAGRACVVQRALHQRNYDLSGEEANMRKQHLLRGLLIVTLFTLGSCEQSKAPESTPSQPA